MAGSLCLVTSSISQGLPQKKPADQPTITAETMARHDETLVGTAKMLSGGDTGYRLADVNEVLGAWLCRQLNTMRPSLNTNYSGTDVVWYSVPNYIVW